MQNRPRAKIFRHGHASWTWTCSKDTDMQHRNEHAAWARISSMNGHGHAAWTRTWKYRMDMDIHHEHGHVASTSSNILFILPKNMMDHSQTTKQNEFIHTSECSPLGGRYSCCSWRNRHVGTSSHPPKLGPPIVFLG
jgi:hypothetical protein